MEFPDGQRSTMGTVRFQFHTHSLKAEFPLMFASFGAVGGFTPNADPNRYNAACVGVCGVEKALVRPVSSKAVEIRSVPWHLFLDEMIPATAAAESSKQIISSLSMHAVYHRYLEISIVFSLYAHVLLRSQHTCLYPLATRKPRIAEESSLRL